MGIHLPSSINDQTFKLCKTFNFPKPSTRTLTLTKSLYSSVHFLRGKESAVQFDDLRQNWNLKRSLFEKLKNKDSDPVRILEDDGDWSKELFWAVVGFLNQTSKSEQVLQVFEKWTSKDDSRATKFNYERLIRLLIEEGLVEAAVLTLREMKNIRDVQASSDIYDLIVRGFIEKGRIEDALIYLKEMESVQMKPHASTYNSLIKVYAKNGLYDDMAKCVKRMESNGCFPDQSTYNLLIREFSVAGLIKRMERTYRIVVSKRMDLEASTMVAMLEVYADFGILEKMEKIYRKILRLKPRVCLKDDLIRKVAAVYIKNHMFSRIDEMGINLYSKTSNTQIIWCLRMLAQACFFSRTGMELVIGEMNYKKVKWSVTIANILLFAYGKMKDFKHFEVVLSEMAARRVKPDIVTCGILYDTHGFGFDGVGGLGYWRKMGHLGDAVEFKTDPLVLVAFGKGEFLRITEELDHRNKVCTYEHLINLVKQHQHKTIEATIKK